MLEASRQHAPEAVGNIFGRAELYYADEYLPRRHQISKGAAMNSNISPGIARTPRPLARFRVLTVDINALTFAQAVETIAGWIAERQRHYVNICTTHTLLECYDTPALSAIVNRAGLATPDGMPLVWLGKLAKLPIERVYGPDLMLALCEYGQERGYRHFFCGGASGVAELLAAKLQARYPQMHVAGVFSPPFHTLSPAEEQSVADMINASDADIVWVGLGTPKQDYWVARFRQLLEAPALIAVGAAFDFHAGRIRQAPRWMQRSGLEWLFRLTQDPRRLWKRYVLGNPRFVYLVVKQMIQHRL
jgi:N-acetylglucosaminyldiphosphoundecaprenol N-acetyl-beta-D-mannosaminyltransferase